MKEYFTNGVVLGLALLLSTTQASETGDSKGPTPEQVQRIKDLKPTLEEIRRVDRNKMPWGLNLCLVEQRGKAARDETLDKHDFSSRVTLVQKHKTRKNKLLNQLTGISNKISTIEQDRKKKIDALNPISKIIQQKKIEEESEATRKPLIKERDDVLDTIKRNEREMYELSSTLRRVINMTDQEISALPDSDKWAEMKKTQCQIGTGKAPAQQPQQQKWQKADISVR